jgi:hypothetical protein
MAFPSWAIAIVIILIIVSVSTIVYFIFRKRIGRRAAVGAQQNEFSLEKSISTHHSPSSSAYPAIKPLIPYNYTDKNEANNTLKDSQALSNHEINNNPSSTIPASPYTCISNRAVDEKKNVSQRPQEQKNASLNATVVQLSNPLKEDDNASSIWTDDALAYSKQESFKINIPLPPPSTSFFSDKMELDSIEANDLYQSYMNISQQDYVSIELDDKPFLSSAAANIQQKAATLRSTLRQSLRRKSTTGKSNAAPLSQFFDNMSHNTTSSNSIRSPAKSSSEVVGTTRISRQSSTTSSRFPRPPLQMPITPSLPFPPSPKPDSPMDYFNKSNNSSKKSLIRHQAEEEESNSNKIMIDTIPHESYFSLSMSPTTPSPFKPTSTPVIPSSEVIIPDYTSVVDEINQYSTDQSIQDDADSEISKGVQETAVLTDKSATPQEAASAAREIIRSASRKSRTRSMIITDEAAQAMFTSFASNGDTMPLTPAAATVAKYATVRGMNRINEDIVRPSPLDIKKWSVSSSNSPSSPSKTPSPQRPITNSIVSGSATVSVRKLQQQGPSSDNLLAASGRRNNLKSATLGRKPTNSTQQGPKSLRNLFSRPSEDSLSEKSLVVDQQKGKPGPSSARSSLSIVTTRQSTETESITAPIEPVVESTSPYSSKNNTLRNKMGSNVDTIRRMLQSSWSGNNLKESGSSHSLASSSGDMTIGSVDSSFRSVASPLGSINPRLQNQHLVSLSLKAQQHQQARSRPSMPVGFMEEGPTPTASFSSSTVRTMIPAEEEQEPQQQQSRLRTQEKKSSVITGLLGSRQNDNNNNNNNNRLQNSKVGTSGFNNNKKQLQDKTPAQKEREKYLKSLERQ